MEKEVEEVLKMFEENCVKYKLYEHEPVYTSEQASQVRGVELRSGVKSIVLKTKDGRFVLADLAADRKIDAGKLGKLAGSKIVGFATAEEVMKVANCEPGSVHPFGKLFEIEIYLDESVLENEFVNFNIGVLTKSVQIRRDDFLKLLEPKLTGEFSKR